MATSIASGTVTSFSSGVNTNNQGTVTVDETDEIMPVVDRNFTSANFSIGQEVTFTITTDDNGNSIASGVQVAPTGQNVTITTSSSNPITANMGDVYTIKGKGTVVSGNISINGGKVIVDQNAVIQPAAGAGITVSGGVMVARGSGQVTGTVININQGGSLKAVNGGSITNSNISINQGGRMIAGNANGPGTIAGTISITGVRGVRVAEDGTSSITG